jgi:23S rRNA (cytosine1962-C5)-methyltransferase
LREEPINTRWFCERLEAARTKREKNISVPYYRLVHSESDGLPGLIIDRFGDQFVCQISTAGMQLLKPFLLDALEQLFAPVTIILRGDIPIRKHEGLEESVQIIKGSYTAPTEIREYETLFLGDLEKGQKTGWFYDQRENRHMMAKLARGKNVLDVYSHSGGFGIPCAKADAHQVTLIDSSALALEMAKKAAIRNHITEGFSCLQGDAAKIMESLHAEGTRFDIVCSDPPAFIPNRDALPAGLKGYAKVARLSAQLVAPEGLLFIASCSHHATRPLFRKAVLEGIKKAGRTATILKQTGAAADHPVHPHLPQSEYLKGLLIQLK